MQQSFMWNTNWLIGKR